jgi:hypothetical protein
MATITQVRNIYRDVVITILGVLENSNSPAFASFGYPISSFTIQGTLDTSSPPSAITVQGSNDGGTTWVTSGTVTVGSLPLSGSLIGTTNQVFQLYRFAVTGGDSGTSLNFYIYLSATFG